MEYRFFTYIFVKGKYKTRCHLTLQYIHSNLRDNAVEASCGCPKYANDVHMNIHNPNPNPNPNPKSLTPP